MFQDITPIQVFVYVLVAIQIVYIAIMVPKIIKLWKKNKARGAILDKMNALNEELSRLVLETPETEERMAEIEVRFAQVLVEFNELSDEFDRIG